MASSSSSLTLSQALLSPHASNDRAIFLTNLKFSALKFSPSSSKSYRISTSSAARLAARHAPIRAAAVEALDSTTDTSLVDKSVNTIRFLAIDSVEKANSGHPGLPMGCAPMGHILYDEVMRYNPKNPYWFNRDRFVLSAGHGCMLQYALLHLAGYDSVKEADLRSFRQWGSKTPGHPENFETPGVEVTTGPLGQGVANAVGLALAEKHLAGRYNKPDAEIVDHYTYCILGDGCQMEGIANEACSLAAHWGLGKLIAFYDDNHISIDGDTEIAFTENVDKRFEGLGWHVIWVKNGNNGYDEIRAAIKEAKAVKDKPTLIKVTTTIGYGSPNKSNSYSVHGSALGAKEVDATRQNLGWPHEPFHVPEDVKKHWSRHTSEGSALEAEWNAKFAEYERKYKDEAAEFKSIIKGELPAGWEKALPVYTPESPADATRNLSQQCLNALATVLPGLLGGSADLASSNMTLMKMFGDFQKDTPQERNIRFGVREHGMGAICNGIALHSPGLIPYCATFFVFILFQLETVVKNIRENYENYQFFKIFQIIQRFVIVDLSNFYFDVAKDRLYVGGTTSYTRKSCQTVLAAHLLSIVRIIAPILPHLAEDVWQNLPFKYITEDGSVAEYVFESRWPASNETWLAFSPEEIDFWGKILELRTEVNKVLEVARGGKLIGSSLDAKVYVHTSDPSLDSRLREMNAANNEADTLHRIFITSQVEVVSSLNKEMIETIPYTGEYVMEGEKKVWIGVSRAQGSKCERCWNYSPQVGSFPEHSTLCGRCCNVVATQPPLAAVAAVSGA